MAHVPVLPEFLSVIGRDDQDGMVQNATSLQLGQKSPHLAVQIGQTRIVGIHEIVELPPGVLLGA